MDWSQLEDTSPAVLQTATPVLAYRTPRSKFELKCVIYIQVFGISSDEPEQNAKFAKDNNLNFPLLSDQGQFLRKSFGIKADLLGLLPGRQTFVIDKQGKVQLSFNDQFGAEKHVGEALQVIERLV